MEYRERTYRNRISKGGLVSFQVKIKETDLYIGADSDCRDAAIQSVHRHREFIEEYIRHNPPFINSMTPVEADGQRHRAAVALVPWPPSRGQSHGMSVWIS
ncbi:MAG: hypothetical protein JRC60_07340 [Deltaproteobacteria bacterium]|nr:hypothetical protein [Deltaproteobacteria bacterium]